MTFGEKGFNGEMGTEARSQLVEMGEMTTYVALFRLNGKEGGGEVRKTAGRGRASLLSKRRDWKRERTEMIGPEFK